MPCPQDDRVRLQCYPGGKSLVQKIIGYALIGGGVLLFLFCVPIWAWLAVIGAAMILIGFVLIRE